MALPISGFISLLDIATELGRPGTPNINNDDDYFGYGSPPLLMSN